MNPKFYLTLLFWIPIFFFGPSIPEWLLDGIIIIIFIAMFGIPMWGFILENRYTGPYTLLAASSEEKWRWAAIIMFCYTIPLPLFGLIDPILNISDPRHWSGFPLFCTGIWIVIFPIAILFKRWGIERQLKSYQKMDKMIKSGFYERLASSPLTGWSFRFMTLFSNAERKRFFEEGYSQEDELDEEIVSIYPSWFIKLVDNTKSSSKWFSRRYPDRAILFAAMATLQEVGNEPRFRWLPRWLYYRRGVVIITEKILFFKSGFLSLAMFITLGISLIPLTFSVGFFLLVYFLLSRAGSETPLTLIPFIFLLIPALLFLMLFFMFALSVLLYRPYQEHIAFQEILGLEVGTVPGAMRRFPSLTFTTADKTFKVVMAKTLPDEIVQIISDADQS